MSLSFHPFSFGERVAINMERCRVQQSVLVGASVVAVVVVLSLLSRWTTSDSHAQHPAVVAASRALFREAARSAYTAEHADHPLLRLLHTIYADANMKAARKFGRERDLERSTGTNAHELASYIEEQQAAEIRNIAETCPALRIDGPLASATGWLT